MSQVRRLAVALLAISACAPLAACSSSDTVLALTISPHKDAPQIEKVHVTITRQAEGGTSLISETFVAPTVEKDSDPTPSFYERIIMNGTTGLVYIHAEGMLHAGGLMGQGDTKAELEEGEAVAATVTFAAPDKPPPVDVDAGPDAAGDDAGDAAEEIAVPVDATLDTVASDVLTPVDATTPDVAVDSAEDVRVDVASDVKPDTTHDAAGETDAPADARADGDATADADAGDAADQ